MSQTWYASLRDHILRYLILEKNNFPLHSLLLAMKNSLQKLVGTWAS